MLTNEQLEDYNQNLLLKYFRKWDRPLYQLVYSNGATEQRYVEGKEYLGPYFIRDVKGVKEMPKYPRDKDTYILEMLVEIPDVIQHEIFGIDGHHTYEPIFMYKKAGRPVDPTWPMVNIFAFFSYALMTGQLRSETWSPEFESWKEDKKGYEDALMILENEMPEMVIALKRGNASFFDATKRAYLIH